MNPYYLAILIINILMLSISIVLVLKNDFMNANTKKGFAISFALLIFAATFEWLGYYFNGKDISLRVPHLIVKFAELSIAPFIPFILGVTIRKPKRVYIFYIILAVHVLIEFLSIFFGITFFVDANNIYKHCLFYPIYYAAYGFGVVFVIYQFLSFNKNFQKLNLVSLILIIIFILAGIITQIVYSDVKIVWMAVAIGLVLFYNYYCDLIRKIDILTELLNRRCYENDIDDAKDSLIVLMLDIDNFKNTNDTYGHSVGDVCLHSAGKLIKEAYANNGKCYRIGGDEFCVIVKNNIENIEALNQRFQTIIDKYNSSVETKLQMSVSLGYANFIPGENTIEEAILEADKMMYQIKEKYKIGR